MTTSPLVLGPMMRYVDETTASVWVETRAAARVSVRAGDRSWDAATFSVHGHHYALADLGGLEPGTVTPYAVDVDGTGVWPDPGSGLPPSAVATLKTGRPLRMAFGSCRTSDPHDASGNRTRCVDALRAYALEMAGGTGLPRPDLIAFLGDQVYADPTSEQMRDFIRARRDTAEPPGEELTDYDEYAHLFFLAWSDPANRWLLSTLPSAMTFDDHDVRDWNTSHSWKTKMEGTSWWRERIVAGLASYWVYQHLGNLSSQERAEDVIWQKTVTHAGGNEIDVSAELDRFADWADQDPQSYRWSYCRDFRLIVVDSRAARNLWLPAAPWLIKRKWPGSTAGCVVVSATCSSPRPCRSCRRWVCTTWSPGMRPCLKAPGEDLRPGPRNCARDWTWNTGATFRTASGRWLPS